MSNDSQQIVNKAWNFAHVLRDDGLSYMAYTEQITFLLFLKMADEQTNPPYNRASIVPEEYGWQSLLAREGDELEVHYRHCLEELGRQPGMLGEIFKKARQEIQNPATLRRLIVDLIDAEQWSMMAADMKGDIYEGLLAKSAAESPKGAGQYFTPRELIKAIVDVVRPGPDDTVCDPAAGTGGFLLSASEYVVQQHGRDLDLDQKKHLRESFAQGWELVPATARLCIMNLYLHGIDADPCPIRSGADSLANDPGDRFSIVLTNPPFGKKSSISIVNEEGGLEKEHHAYERQDFWTATKNKQLNFLQHVKTLLKMNGRCAIVVPDNVLFEGVLARQYVGTCSSSSMCTLSCDYPPDSSTRRVLRRTFCSSMHALRKSLLGPRSSGFMTFAPTCTSRLRRTRLSVRTWMSSSPATTLSIGTTAKKGGAKRMLMAGGAASTMKS